MNYARLSIKIIAIGFFVDALAAESDSEYLEQGTEITQDLSSQQYVLLPVLDVEFQHAESDYAPEMASVATKTPLTLRETPQSLSVITQQRFEDQGFTSLTEALTWVPGVVNYRRDETEAPAFYSRGYQLNNFMVDGSLIGGGNWQMPADLTAYESVEVLRGPAGLFIGNGTNGSPAGVVNITRKRPKAQPSYALDIAYGSWSQQRVSLEATGALNKSQTLRGIITAGYLNREFFSKYSDRENTSVNGVIEYDVLPNTMLTVGLSYENRNSVPQTNGLPLNGDGSDPHWDISTSTTLPWGKWLGDTYNAFAEIKHKFNDKWDIKIVYTYQKEELLWDFAWVTGVVNPIEGSTQDETYIDSQRREIKNSERSLDIRVNGKFTLWGREHQVILGFDALRQDEWAMYPREYGYDYSIRETIDFVNFDPSLYPYKPHTIDRSYWRTYGPTKQSGVYANFRIKLLDPLVLTTGVRLSRYSYDGYFRPATNTYASGAYNEDNIVTPFYALSWDFKNNTTIYLSYAEIFNVQNSYTTSGDMVDPESGENIELGIKKSFWNNRLNASAAIYELDMKNQTRRDPDAPYPCPGSPTLGYCYIADNEQRTRGLDLELTGALTPNWDASIGVTWTSLEYTKDKDNTGQVSDDQGQSWNQDMPSRMLKAWVSYKVPDFKHNLRLGLGALVQSEIYAEREATATVNAAKVKQAGYAVWNGSATFDLTKNWKATFNINNILDKRYYSQVGTSSVVYGEPRNYLLTLRATFK